MSSGDIIFYGIIAISAISSIVKAVKKNTANDENKAMPDFKGSDAGKWVKSIFEEIGDKDDDFIPSNPKPASNKTPFNTYKAPIQTSKPQSEVYIPRRSIPIMRPEPMFREKLVREAMISPFQSSLSASSYNKIKNATENMPRRESFKEKTVLPGEEVLIATDSNIFSFDLSETEELRKAVIYSEILRPKF